MNDGMWIKVTGCLTGKRVAVHLAYVVTVREDIANGRRATIDFSDGTSMEVYESFDEIGAMFR